MKAYDITKLIAELKSDNVQYRNKIIIFFVACFNHLTYSCVIYSTAIH